MLEPLPARPSREFPLYHHPAIAISLILILASVVQVGVRLVSTQLLPPTFDRPSFVIVHGMLFDVVEQIVSRQTGGPGADQPVMFLGCLMISLSSGIAWYGAARLALGRAWGLWTGLCWVAYPAFAFLAPRSSPLALLILLIPVVWCLLLGWRRTHGAVAAFVVGLGLGLLSLISVQGVLLLPAILLVMLLGKGTRRRRWSGAGLALAGFVLLVTPSFPLMVSWLTRRAGPDRPYRVSRTIQTHLWNAFDDGDGSSVAEAARGQRSSHPPGQPPSPVQFLASQWQQSPRAVARWFAARLRRTLYATSSGQLQGPLAVLQLCGLVPALWGLVIAWRYPPWRWVAVTAGLFVAPAWLLAALGEPLARNLTPVAGFGILFALAGVADVYERIFGRRLTKTAKARPPGGSS